MPNLIKLSHIKSSCCFCCPLGNHLVTRQSSRRYHPSPSYSRCNIHSSPHPSRLSAVSSTEKHTGTWELHIRPGHLCCSCTNPFTPTYLILPHSTILFRVKLHTALLLWLLSESRMKEQQQYQPQKQWVAKWTRGLAADHSSAPFVLPLFHHIGWPLSGWMQKLFTVELTMVRCVGLFLLAHFECNLTPYLLIVISLEMFSWWCTVH